MTIKKNTFLQWLKMQMGFVSYRMGEWDKAEQSFRHSIELHSATADKTLLLENTFFLVKIKIKAGQFVLSQECPCLVSLLEHCLSLAMELQETRKFNYLQSLVGIHRGSTVFRRSV